MMRSLTAIVVVSLSPLRAGNRTTVPSSSRRPSVLPSSFLVSSFTVPLRETRLASRLCLAAARTRAFAGGVAIVILRILALPGAGVSLA